MNVKPVYRTKTFWTCVIGWVGLLAAVAMGQVSLGEFIIGTIGAASQIMQRVGVAK